MTDITIIICGLALVLIGLIAFVIFKYIRPFINAKSPANQWNTIVDWAKGLVSLAEKNIYGEHGLGNIRFEKVLGQLQDLCNKYGYKFDEDMLKSAIQYAWTVLIGKIDKKKEEMIFFNYN